MKIPKIGMIGALGGMIIGCISWIIIVGVSLGSLQIIIFPIIFGLICILFAWRSYRLHPERSLSIVGAALIWLMVLNFMAANFLYELIPETIWEDAPQQYVQFFTTGKSQVGLLFINIWLSIFTLAGIVLIIVDIARTKK
jgi:hypothetical protein